MTEQRERLSRGRRQSGEDEDRAGRRLRMTKQRDDGKAGGRLRMTKQRDDGKAEGPRLWNDNTARERWQCRGTMTEQDCRTMMIEGRGDDDRP